MGNICRSPLAEAIFNHKIQKLGLSDQFESDSCGTSNYHIGDSPDHRAIKCAVKNGVEVHHAGRQISFRDLEQFDLILAMDSNNYGQILQLPNARSHRHKIDFMRSYDPLGTGDVPDPYYGSDADFQFVFDMLDRSIDQLIVSIQI